MQISSKTDTGPNILPILNQKFWFAMTEVYGTVGSYETVDVV